ncbi:MAG TPA: transcriptional regulator [Candidatus Saccharimonadia bacterium]|nr:transcriptional regulator [Candidatus Saccharimonadia bacterium]
MIEQLFGSKTRVKLLQLFYGNTNRSFYVREITRKIDEQINSVRRELANLLSIGIITSNTSNNRLYYEVDQKYEYYSSLNEIFGSGKKVIKKTKKEIAVDSPILNIGNIDLAIYTGHFTRDEISGIDILIVGNVNPTQLNRFIVELEAQEAKELRYVVLSSDEFDYRLEVNDRFVNQVINSKKQIIVDKKGLLDKINKN